MLIREWRVQRKLSLAQAAVAVGAGSGRTLLNWENGKCLPRPPQMRRIYLVTRGAVQPNDFYGLPPLEDEPRPGDGDLRAGAPQLRESDATKVPNAQPAEAL